MAFRSSCDTFAPTLRSTRERHSGTRSHVGDREFDQGLGFTAPRIGDHVVLAFSGARMTHDQVHAPPAAQEAAEQVRII
ncbi:hypothetical protein, partial [Klebsiella aerogenes]|uniref:hypothetical protein n=1 Tax=Klebsiella aerogenes TaxID=548 RepID=UPI0019532A51